MSAIIVPTVSSITVHNRQPAKATDLSLDALGHRAWAGIRTLSDLLERRFAEFAGVPYEEPFCRREWEDLWETEFEQLRYSR